MQIGVISDIHGNFQALEAIWREFTALGIAGEAVLNAGDSVGYGDQPEECIAFLRAHPNIVSVQGNYDRNVAKFPKDEEKFYRKWGETRPEKFEGLARGSARISESARKWLLDLPKEARLTLEGVRIVVNHYAPDEKTGLGPWDTDARFKAIAATAEADVVVTGHTHAAFIRAAGGVLFINPGASGRSGTSRCPYAILSINHSRASAELARVTLK